jgi:tetrahydromethanopterin S-methyltransferase subunit G
MISVKSEVKLVEDKTFELLERMYAEFSEFRKESGQRFDNIDNRLDRVEGHVTQVDKRLDRSDGLVDDKLGKVEGSITQINNRLDKVDGHLTRIEIEHGKKLDALFVGYNQTYEKLQEHDKRFDNIDTKIDKLFDKVSIHDSKLKVLEGGRNK